MSTFTKEKKNKMSKQHLNSIISLGSSIEMSEEFYDPPSTPHTFSKESPIINIANMVDIFSNLPFSNPSS